MKKELEMKLEKIKKTLGNDCEYIALAHIEEKSNENLMNCKEGLDVYYEVKNKYAYLRFAEVIFCVDEEKFKDYQVFIMMYKVPKQKEWICIGESEPYPLVLNTKTGIVNCVLSEPGQKCEMKEYVKFEEFMDKYVLGEKYLELGSSGKWYEFMKEHEII
ncbi:hypothetical protein [Clostridium tagluense]|uniref:Uncharacterized protein n=1 Tax=Clostridium tagluense TaxID=360422 RepID=A0A401UKH9_9CLOT|nr:hypothetical protein [Clostridium tagluense]GCD10046.1 hypothetical protein Ctaglu_16690 [Clostridium tagluense]